MVGFSMMTPDEQKLCTNIAEAEKWEQVQIIRGMVAGVPPLLLDNKYTSTGEKTYVGADTRMLRFTFYLTDPAERWRMLEALIEYYDDEVYFSANSVAGLALSCTRYLNPRHNVEIEDAESTPVAVAEAYLAMLLAKRDEE